MIDSSPKQTDRIAKFVSSHAHKQCSSMFLRLTDNVTVNRSMHVLPFQNVLYFYFVCQGSAAYDWDENIYK